MASITRNRSGSYRVRWNNPNQKTFSKSFKDLKAAKVFKLELELEFEKNGYEYNNFQNGKKFEDLCDFWINHAAVHKKSLKDDVSIIKTHLLPRYALHELHRITNKSTIQLRSDLETRLKPKTVSNILTLLKTMLNRAHELKWLKEVPIIRKPKIPKINKNYQYLRNKSQVNEFLEKSREEEDCSIELFYLFALTTGMRLGEICAMTWDKVNFDTRLITVSCSYTGSTKNNESRQVLIVDSLVSRLKEWKQHVNGDLVFPNRRGNMHCKNPRIAKEIFHRVLRKCSFQSEFEKSNPGERYIKFHSLRHTFASHYMMEGGCIYRLKEILGHKSLDVTMVYAHLDPDRFREDHKRFNFINNKAENTGKVINLF